MDPLNNKIISIQNYLKGFHDKRLFVTSSFQTHSIPLLHIISQVPEIKVDVVLTNTGFLFNETITFASDICYSLGLNLIEISPPLDRAYSRAGARLIYSTDTDSCCSVHKVQPLQAQILPYYDVWINGVRADQTEQRSLLKTIEKTAFDCFRYHPMLTWTDREIFTYRKRFDLPEHPLEQKGYLSVGCEPCTRKVSSRHALREGRWAGSTKTECGLNTILISGVQ